MTIRVFVSGQSNALGRNAGGPDWSTISADVRVWNNVNPLGANGTAFTTAALARAGGTFENTDRNNFGVWFCDRLALETGDDVDMTIVARGATTIAGWAPGNPIGMLQECIDVWAATGQAPADIFLWHQGEGNVTDDLATYGAAFNDLLTNLEAGGVIDSSTIVLLGGLSQVGDADKIAFNENVLQPLAQSLPLGGYANPGTLPTDDGTHFTGDALYWLGYARYFAAYEVATKPPLFVGVNEGGVPGVAGSGANSLLDMEPIRVGVAAAMSALQPGDSIGWDWITDVPANIALWGDISPIDAGLYSTNTNITDWDALFGLSARFIGYTNGVSSGGPIAASGVGLLIPRSSNQAGEVFIQSTSSSTQRAFFRGGGAATWGPWREFLHDGNYPPTAGYRLKGAPIFITASGTYTPSAGTVAILVEVLGGGGGGGGAGSSGGVARAGLGGGAGGYGRSFIASPASSYSVTIGAAGAGGTAGINAGTTGGTTSFGSISCTGGGGGPSPSGSGAVLIIGTTAGGSSTGADVNVSGWSSSAGYKLDADNRLSGKGGDSIYGAGGSSRVGSASTSNNAGISASGYGAGGGGGLSSTTVDQAGGNGAPGVVVVWEYVR